MSSENSGGEVVPIRTDESKVVSKKGSQSGRIRHSPARDLQAYEMSLAGATYVQIAKELGWADASGAQKAVERVRTQIKLPAAEEMRAQQVERLERLFLTAYPAARARNWEAMREARELLKQEAKLLGLDIAKIEVSGRDGGPIDVQVVADVREFVALLAVVASDSEAAASLGEAPANPVLPVSANGEAGTLPS